jgi:hypothetical protein
VLGKPLAWRKDRLITLSKVLQSIKIFHSKQKLKQYMTIKPPLQKFLQGILHRENKSKQNHERIGSIKPQEKKRQGIRE